MFLFPHFDFRPRLKWSAILLLTTALALSLLGPTGLAQAPIQVASEYNLKLARMYATAKFVIWPDEADNSQAPFVIGVLAPDPFQGGLQKLASRKLKDRPIRVVTLKAAQDYQQCHLLFIPAGADSELVKSMLQRIEKEPVLVWQDQADSRRPAGVSCTFVRQGDELLIEADPAELKRRGLTPDGRLLSLNLVRVIKSGK